MHPRNQILSSISSALLALASVGGGLAGCIDDLDSDLDVAPGATETSTDESELLAPYHLLQSANAANGCLKNGDGWVGAVPEMHPACANEAKYAWAFSGGTTGMIRSQNHPASTNLCLGAGAATPGTPVSMAACNSTALGQKFHFQPIRQAGGKTFGQIVSKRSGACLASGGGAGAHPVMRACADVPNQLWALSQPPPAPPPVPTCSWLFCYEDSTTQICSARYKNFNVNGPCNDFASAQAFADQVAGIPYRFRNLGFCPTACF